MALSSRWCMFGGWRMAGRRPGILAPTFNCGRISPDYSSKTSKNLARSVRHGREVDENRDVAPIGRQPGIVRHHFRAGAGFLDLCDAKARRAEAIDVALQPIREARNGEQLAVFLRCGVEAP